MRTNKGNKEHTHKVLRELVRAPRIQVAPGVVDILGKSVGHKPDTVRVYLETGNFAVYRRYTKEKKLYPASITGGAKAVDEVELHLDRDHRSACVKLPAGFDPDDPTRQCQVGIHRVYEVAAGEFDSFTDDELLTLDLEVDHIHNDFRNIAGNLRVCRSHQENMDHYYGEQRQELQQKRDNVRQKLGF